MDLVLEPSNGSGWRYVFTLKTRRCDLCDEPFSMFEHKETKYVLSSEMWLGHWAYSCTLCNDVHGNEWKAVDQFDIVNGKDVLLWMIK